MAITGKARSKIRSAMKEEKRKVGELAKEALERKLRNMKIDFSDNVDFLTKHYGFKHRPDLYYAYATAALKITDIKKFDVVDGKLTVPAGEVQSDNAEKEAAAEVKRPRKNAADTKSNILVNGEPIDQFKYELAACCKPVQGDGIFGYLTSNQLLKVHRINCKNSTNLLANYGYRVLKAEWSRTIGSNYVVDLRVTGVDSGVGVIQALSHAISVELGVNIRSFSINGLEGYFEGNISVVVMNKDQLIQVVKRIEKVDGISTVARIDKHDND